LSTPAPESLPPEQSFILFGDGTPVTLEAMKKWQFKNLDLIVLSACETGLDGNFGSGYFG